MNKLLLPIGLILLVIVSALARLLLLCKIYDVTAHVFGGPQLSMWQMFTLSTFLVSCTTVSTSSPKKEATSAKVANLVSSLLGLLITWGLARLIFGA